MSPGCCVEVYHWPKHWQWQGFDDLLCGKRDMFHFLQRDDRRTKRSSRNTAFESCPVFWHRELLLRQFCLPIDLSPTAEGGDVIECGNGIGAGELLYLAIGLEDQQAVVKRNGFVGDEGVRRMGVAG